MVTKHADLQGKELTRFSLRIPTPLYEKVVEKARRNKRSVNAELMEMVEKYAEEEEKVKFSNLEDLTKQESGIILYGKQGILCNWSGYDGLPRMFAAGLLAMGEEIPDVPGEHYSDLSDLLDGVDITAYADDAEIPTSGTVYRLDDDVIVIAPDEWN